MLNFIKLYYTRWWRKDWIANCDNIFRSTEICNGLRWVVTRDGQCCVWEMRVAREKTKINWTKTAQYTYERVTILALWQRIHANIPLYGYQLSRGTTEGLSERSHGHRSSRKSRGGGQIEARLSPLPLVPFSSPFLPLFALTSMSP